MILKPEAVRVLSGTTSKKRLMQELGAIAEAAYGVPHAIAVEALLERESLGPTGVGHGVALPHARIEGIDQDRFRRGGSSTRRSGICVVCPD